MPRLGEVLALSSGTAAGCQIAFELAVEGVRSLVLELLVATVLHIVTEWIRALGTWQALWKH